MPLINDELSVWDISYRWSSFDPDILRFKHPLSVKDNFKLLINAILNAELYCETLTLVKRPFDSKADPNYYIRTYIDDVYACIWGKKYNKKLLKWALISRGDFKEWCQRRAIPLPEFWFPEGWNDSFEWPEYGTRSSWARHVEPETEGGFSLRFDIPEQIKTQADNDLAVFNHENDIVDSQLRPNQLSKLLVQRIALNIWESEPTSEINISQMARHNVIQKYCGVGHYQLETIMKWIREVAPVEIKGKRGRPSNKYDEHD